MYNWICILATRAHIRVQTPSTITVPDTEFLKYNFIYYKVKINQYSAITGRQMTCFVCSHLNIPSWFFLIPKNVHLLSETIFQPLFTNTNHSLKSIAGNKENIFNCRLNGLFVLCGQTSVHLSLDREISNDILIKTYLVEALIQQESTLFILQWIILTVGYKFKTLIFFKTKDRFVFPRIYASDCC